MSQVFYKGLDDEQITLDQKSLKKLSKEIAAYRGVIAELEPYELSVILRKYEQMIMLARKLSNYAFLYKDTHMDSEEAEVFQSKIGESVADYFKMLGFIHFELNALDIEKKYEFLNHPKLARWVPWLKNIFSSYWSLDEVSAFIIDQKSIVSASWSKLYEETLASLKFRFGGKTLDRVEMGKLLSSSDPKVRAKASREINRVYKQNAHIFSKCYNMIMQDKRTDDTLYGAREPVETSLSANHISKEDLLAMSSAVVDSYITIPQRFFKLMAKIRKTNKLCYTDTFINPVSITQKKKLTWQDCVQDVLEAYAVFSTEYMLYGASIINNQYVDVPADKNKRSGAYCLSGEYPYILLNFTGCQSDISTFAHELGHGVHHLLSAQIGELNDSTPTTLSEVASEFAENLVFQKHLKEAKTNKEKLHLLIDRVQDMIGSIHRQVSYFKFEERTHRERAKGSLSTARLNQIWREESSRYFGFDVSEDAEALWMGIPHLFSMPYYVYSYAFAGLIANNLIIAYEKWEEKSELENTEDFADLYIDMLSNTGVENYKSLLEPFGIDATDPMFWVKGLKLIERYINEIEKLAKSEGLI